MEQPFSLDQITASLIVEGFEPAEKLRWLEKSYEMREAFFTALLSVYGRTHGYSAKTVPFKQYDFYFDIFEKQNHLEKLAYIYYDSSMERHEVTYEQLRHLVDMKAGAWLLRGAVRGNVICIVRPLCLEYVVCVLAALKIGLVLSFLSPYRPYVIQKQLQALNPDYITTGKAYDVIVKQFHAKIIDTMVPCEEKVRQGVMQRSCAFISGETAAKLFDYTSDQMFEPVDITCDELFLHPLRDGLIAMDLRPGDVLSAPGFSFCDTQPAMVLSSLLAGATFLDIKLEQCRRTPAILSTDAVTTLGVTSQLRNLIQEKSMSAPTSCRFWFRAPSQSTEYNQWHLFIKKAGIGHILTGVLKWSSQTGGLLFFSRKRVGLAVDNLMPSAGLPWQLAPGIPTEDTPAVDVGILTIASHKEDKMTPWLVMKNMYEWLLLGSRFVEKKGKYYPLDVVHQFIQSTGICRYFFLTERASSASTTPRIHLVVFMGFNPRVNGAEISDKIYRKISLSMGREYCPDTIDYFAMMPRLHPDGSMDEAWCRAQYAENRLTKKSKNSIFMGLSLIKSLIRKKI